MAHAARVSEIADKLVQIILGVDKDDPIIAQTRSTVTRGLRDGSYGRTNQFEVKSRLDGLVEKFSVLNRDDLSDALQERIEELPTRSKWLPEILELFLSLSDRPVEKTAPDALAVLYAAEHPDEQLTWQDIIADDPLDEAGIWDDIERGYHSSGDETGFDDDDLASEPTTSTQATSADEDSTDNVVRLYVTQPDYEQLDFGKLSANATKDAGPRVAELMVVRESLCMLRGLPTNIYDITTGTGTGTELDTILVRPDVTLVGVSRRVLSDAMEQFATLGRTLQYLRRWTQSKQSLPYVNTCQATIERWLVDLSSKVSTLEERYVGSSVDVVVSSIEVLSELQHITRHLSHFAAIAAHESQSAPFALLDELYDCVCTSQLSGDDDIFDSLSSMLYKATQTYLRPVAVWVSSGTIAEGHDDFFAVESGRACGAGDLWHSKYMLRKSNDGQPSTPRFMQDSIAEMFALGKARMFLNQLTQAADESDGLPCTYQLPDFDTMRRRIQDCPLMPFSDMFNETLQYWIQTVSTDVTPNLKVSLLETHGLLCLLTAIDCTYFSANGALFQDFADSLFDRIRRAPPSWANNFLLTELAKETFGGDACVDHDSLSVEVDLSSKSSNVTQLLQGVNVAYQISWPLQNITRERSPNTHAKAFTFLLQASYAYHALQSRTFGLRPLSPITFQRTHNIAFHLRHTFIVFTTTLRTHFTTVSRILQTEVRAAMLEARTIDAMVIVYELHRKRLAAALLLSTNLTPIREAMVSCLSLCEQFGPLWDAATAEETARSTRHDTEKALQQLKTEFYKTVSFLAAGVRNVSRVGGETLLEALAEQLDMIVTR